MSLWDWLELSMLVFSLTAIVFLGYQVSLFPLFAMCFKHRWGQFLCAFFVVLAVFVSLIIWQGFLNTVICFFYTSIIWFLCRLLVSYLQKKLDCLFNYTCVGLAALIFSFCYLLNAWYQAHHVWVTSYTLASSKLSTDLRFVLLADAHIGTTFHGKDFAQYVSKIQTYKPDAVFIAGDFVDNNTSRDEFLDALQSLSSLKTKYGVYLVLGNHDISSNGQAFRGFSNDYFISELKDYGIKVLQDDVELVNDDFYIVGRKDAFEPRRGRSRLSMFELVKALDYSKFILVLDHQPNDYRNQAYSSVDLVLSGHTHGGQLFPFNNLGKWLGFNDAIYGYERLDNTDFIVTSGISDWELLFKTGCRSEFVVIDIKSNNS